MDLVCYAAADTPAPPPGAEARDVLTFPSWGGGLTLEQYLERERRLWRHPFSRGLRRWVLVGGEPLASCETYAVPARSGKQGGVAQGVASVYVEERLRGRGHARALLERLHERLRAEGALCSYLISEVDPAMYERLGYVSRPLSRRRFSAPLPGEPEPGIDEVRWLAPADVPALLARRYATAERAGLQLLLTPEQLDWHAERGRLYAAVLGRPAPEAVGASCGEAFAIWAHDHRADLLRVLCLYPGPALYAAGVAAPRDPAAAALRNVLHAARAEAAHAGLGAVEIWDNARSGWLRGGQQQGGGDPPMLRPLQRGVRAEEWLDWERGHWL